MLRGNEQQYSDLSKLVFVMKTGIETGSYFVNTAEVQYIFPFVEDVSVHVQVNPFPRFSP